MMLFHRKRIVQKIVESKPIVNEKGVPIAVDFRLCSTCLTDKSLASIHCSVSLFRACYPCCSYSTLIEMQHLRGSIRSSLSFCE